MANGENKSVYCMLNNMNLLLLVFVHLIITYYMKENVSFPYEIHTEILLEAKSRCLKLTLKQGVWEKEGGRGIEERKGGKE